MALLTSKFDVLRGWPKEGAIDETFLADNGTDEMAPGDLVTLTATGVEWAGTNATPKPVFVVVEGDNDYSGTFTGKVVVLRGNCLVRIENYETAGAEGTFAVGTQVSYDNAGTGKWIAAQSGDQVIGEVWKDDRTANGTMDIYFHGGMSVKA